MYENTVLKKIILDKKEWIFFHKKRFPTKKFYSNLQPTNRDFYKALSFSKKLFILECKKAVPIKGIIKSNFDLKSIAKIYQNYADVISVITDEKHFQGKFQFIKKISNIVSQPILCKDFIIDEWQIYMARFYEADAILLMLSILNDDDYIYFSNIAKKFRMGILTEVNNEKELKRALLLKAKVIGINNRNLNNLSIDFKKTKILSTKIPKGIRIISESGINSYAQIKNLSKYVHGFLIGTSLMKEKNLNLGIRKILLGENKVCGLTNISDANACYNAGAIYGGLIFVSQSPRYIEIKKAFSIIDHTNTNFKFVGVFCNHSIQEIAKIVIFLKLSVVQLHGQEDLYYINQLKKILPLNCQIWKAFDIKKSTPDLINKYQVSRYLLDNKKGGSGKSFNWSNINGINFQKTILAGGISEINCLKASSLGFAGLDFNSKVEIAPGIKNHQKIYSIFKILKNY